MGQTGRATAIRQRIGEWEVVPELNELRRGDESVRIEPKAMELLVFLAAHPGEVIGRAELLNTVWPGVVVGDEVLTQAVTKLRKALADEARTPAYIETISKRGYRLLAEVRTLPASSKETVIGHASPAGSSREETQREVPQHRFGRSKIAAAVTLGLVVAVVSAWILLRATSAPTESALTPPIGAASQPDITAQTIAIAPFENLTGDQQHDYLARGIAADLATDLATLSGLHVIELSHHAARGSEAGADAPRYRVAGTLQLTASQLRVNVRLIDTASSRHLWSERYDRPFRDLLAVQTEIVARLVEALSLKVTEAERQRVSRRYTQNEQAYDLFLRGQSLLASRQQADAAQARDLYRKALELDPAFARAYAALALTYAYEYRYRWTHAGAQSLQRALELAETARQINQDIPEIYWVLAFVHAQRREHGRAVGSLKKALDLNPSYGDAHAFMGAVLTYIGRFDEALPFLRTALRFNPEGRAYIFELLGRLYFFLGDMEQALINLRKAVSRNPAVVDSHVFLAAALVASGERSAAQWEAEEIRSLEPSFTTSRWIETYPTTEKSQKTRLATLLAEVGL
jgi:DNA-binding winged helix-turn-helix (wHTH) protein/TolB-like protein/Flp pilus assembly protein TadD